MEPQTRRSAQHSTGAAFDIIALAASAGGLTALSRVLTALPADFPAVIVVVQHLDPRHRSLMADILSRRTPLQVKQAEEGEKVSPATVYIAPPNRHLLEYRKNKATFHASPPAPPRTSPVSPLGALPSRTRTPAAGESSVDRQAGRAPSAPHATQSGEGAGLGLVCPMACGSAWCCIRRVLRTSVSKAPRRAMAPCPATVTAHGRS